MDFDLSEELVAVRELARDFAQKEIAPTAAKDDQEHKFRRKLVTKMGQLGFFGSAIPEEYGGSGLGFLAMVLITEEIARVHSAMRVHINMQVGPALTLLRHGTEKQKKEWIPSLVSGEAVGCFAITEANAGSDVAAMTTAAAKNAKGYILNGTKTWISNAPVADTALVYAVTDKSLKHRGISAFFMDLNRHGVNRGNLEKMGVHASLTGELTFDDVKIPADGLIGREGEGFKICMWQLNQTRLSCAAGALGVATAARDAAVSYANQRVQFGQKIGKFQMIQDAIAQMVVEEEAARLLVYRAALLADNKNKKRPITLRSPWLSTPRPRRRPIPPTVR
jgi:glutaryl-CoA dehydrogenase (non-decarboxylating)